MKHFYDFTLASLIENKKICFRYNPFPLKEEWNFDIKTSWFLRDNTI